eukprot:Nitzschia sp. Nitz4//scaffold202_size38995//34114//35856//NITZ4_007637-RA/size38995-processed-gene-0.50-mRNA-1//-1//CDS//3329541399//4065//frame0
MSSNISTSRIRKRPVCFGNPALGTYNGCVYTLENDGDWRRNDLPRPLVEGVDATERMVAMVDVPPEQVPEGILHLARSHRPFIDHVRIVIAEPSTETSAPKAIPSLEFASGESLPSRTYLVLFRMTSEEAADEFVQDLHGKPYTSLDESLVCNIHTVIGLQGEGGVSLLNPMFAPSTKGAHGALEIVPSISAGDEEGDKPKVVPMTTTSKPNTGPSTAIAEESNCAVCLEHMSLDPDKCPDDKRSILTTVCNHTFHLNCLVQWQDSPCPVCRYDHSGLNETLSQCHICGTTERNYVCLICGVISCIGGGSGAAGLAIPHHPGGYSHSGKGGLELPPTAASAHASSLATATHAPEPSETTAQRFYSTHAAQHYDETLHAYALDTETQHVWDFAGQGYVHRLLQNKEDGKLVEGTDPNTSSQERSMTPGLSDTQEGEVVHRKLEGFASQYYTLLKGQLEQQRTFYEGRLEEIRREFASRKADAATDRANLINVMKQERKQLAQRLTSLKRKEGKVLEDVAFLRNMNESLEANKVPLERKIQQAQREQIASRELLQKTLPSLEEKVTTLMLQLEESLGTSGDS